ncbi:MAG: hypothetical protein HQ518_30535 [Rhodopirellula sp.]|nr:hypothetical protein [Rhodopirellula sp.]
MPDPLVYLKAIVTTAIVSTLVVLTMARWRRCSGMMWLNSSCVLGIAFGLSAGYRVLEWRLVWPPMNGLDRFLTGVLPTALAIELVAGNPTVPRWLAWLLRIALAAATPRILLHGSVYLTGTADGWNYSQAVTTLTVCAVLLASLWSLLSWLARRSPGISIPLALSLAILCAGMSIMLAGYLKGGTAAFPLAATLVATTFGTWLFSKRSDIPSGFGMAAILGIGAVGLFSLLFIGRFFGQLSDGRALAILLAPLLCWLTEIPRLRNRKPWIVGSLRLLLVAIPLALVLAAAKRDFDRDLAPLLVNRVPHRFSTADTSAPY